MAASCNRKTWVGSSGRSALPRKPRPSAMALPQLLLATATAVPDVASESVGAVPLAIDVPHQERDNWCWCAVTVGVSQFYDGSFSLTQCQTAAQVLSIA